jgi:hypothetical protein
VFSIVSYQWQSQIIHRRDAEIAAKIGMRKKCMNDLSRTLRTSRCPFFPQFLCVLCVSAVDTEFSGRVRFEKIIHTGVENGRIAPNGILGGTI